MKSIFVFMLFGTMISMAFSQRPFYAGTRPIGYPELAARFGTEEPPETTTVNLNNRFGEDGQPITTTTQRLPIDALGDRELIKRIQTWPRDKWPFWYVNYVAIEEHRKNRPDNTQPNVNTRSSFAPAINNS